MKLSAADLLRAMIELDTKKQRGRSLLEPPLPPTSGADTAQMNLDFLERRFPFVA
jgi:hypothetical protein